MTKAIRTTCQNVTRVFSVKDDKVKVIYSVRKCMCTDVFLFLHIHVHVSKPFVILFSGYLWTELYICITKQWYSAGQW